MADALFDTEPITGEHLAPVPADDVRRALQGAGISDLVEIRLVEYLVQDRGYTVEQVIPFLKQETAGGLGVAEVLQRNAMITDHEILEITASLYNMEPVTLSQADVEEEMARHLLTPEQAAEWKALPFSRDDLGRLLVAISDPAVEKRDGIQQALPRETIVFCLGSPDEVSTWIERVYDPSASGALSTLLQSGEGEEGERFVVREAALESRIVRIVDQIIEQARESRASDVHIRPGETQTDIRFRIDGILRTVSQLSTSDTARVMARIKTMAQMRVDEQRAPQDGRATTRTGPGREQLDLRINTFPTIYGEQASIRLLDPAQTMLSLEQLGMSQQNLQAYMGAIVKPHGICLVTGPTGSGKSTTLYASLNRVSDPTRNLISIEDPVEYRLQGITQIDVAQNSERMNFASALRSILRADPDIIMVGEIRDQETAQIAIDAALTGHFLYSTLHTNSALGTIIRLGRIGVDRFLIAEALEVVVSQRLIRRLCQCKIAQTLDLANMPGMQVPAWALSGGNPTVYAQNPNGCPACSGQGYLGRTGIYEVLPMTSELRAAIIGGSSQEELERLIRSQGVIPLREDAMQKVLAGETSIEEMNRVTA